MFGAERAVVNMDVIVCFSWALRGQWNAFLTEEVLNVIGKILQSSHLPGLDDEDCDSLDERCGPGASDSDL
jgi:hypothetical protein